MCAVCRLWIKERSWPHGRDARSATTRVVWGAHGTEIDAMSNKKASCVRLAAITIEHGAFFALLAALGTATKKKHEASARSVTRILRQHILPLRRLN